MSSLKLLWMEGIMMMVRFMKNVFLLAQKVVCMCDMNMVGTALMFTFTCVLRLCASHAHMRTLSEEQRLFNKATTKCVDGDDDDRVASLGLSLHGWDYGTLTTPFWNGTMAKKCGNTTRERASHRDRLDPRHILRPSWCYFKKTPNERSIAAVLGLSFWISELWWASAQNHCFALVLVVCVLAFVHPLPLLFSTHKQTHSHMHYRHTYGFRIYMSSCLVCRVLLNDDADAQ